MDGHPPEIGRARVFFHNGFVEDNPRFTVSGHRGDIPISYRAGNRKIFGDAIANLRVSVINNVTGQIIERVFIRLNPNHRKLIRVILWIERSSMASYLSYPLSAGHFRPAAPIGRITRSSHHDVLGTGVALFVALGVGWAWGTSGRADINRALQIAELRHGVLEGRAAVPHPHDLAPIARALRGRGVGGHPTGTGLSRSTTFRRESLM